MLKNSTPLYVYFKKNLKGENTWDNTIYYIFIIHFFGASKKLCIIKSIDVRCNSSLSKLGLLDVTSLK